MTKEQVQKDIDSLPQNYKTEDIDCLIRRYVKEKQDLSCLREYVLTEQQFHRIYFHGSLKQIRDVQDRMQFIDRNLLFSDWWHTDELIDFVKDIDVNLALRYAAQYTMDEDPFIRRWGYVMFISKLCRQKEALPEILALMHNDDHYYVQMAEAWLLAELAVFYPDEIFEWISRSDLKYNIIGKTIQKICDSYRIEGTYKDKFKKLRTARKQVR